MSDVTFPLTYKGKVYKNYQQLVDDSPIKITVSGFKSRIHYGGMTIEEAMTKPLRFEKGRYEYNGQFYNSLEDLHRISPMAYSSRTIRNRLKAGWTIAEAINNPADRSSFTFRGNDEDAKMGFMMWFVDKYIMENNRKKQKPVKINDNEYLFRRHILDWYFSFAEDNAYMQVYAKYRLSGIKSYPIYRCMINGKTIKYIKRIEKSEEEKYVDK